MFGFLLNSQWMFLCHGEEKSKETGVPCWKNWHNIYNKKCCEHEAWVTNYITKMYTTTANSAVDQSIK